MSEYQDDILCPHCGYKCEDYPEHFTMVEDGEESDIQCMSCGRWFTCTVSITFRFLSEPLVDGRAR